MDEYLTELCIQHSTSTSWSYFARIRQWLNETTIDPTRLSACDRQSVEELTSLSKALTLYSKRLRRLVKVACSSFWHWQIETTCLADIELDAGRAKKWKNCSITRTLRHVNVMWATMRITSAYTAVRDVCKRHHSSAVCMQTVRESERLERWNCIDDCPEAWVVESCWVCLIVVYRLRFCAFCDDMLHEWYNKSFN